MSPYYINALLGPSAALLLLAGCWAETPTTERSRFSDYQNPATIVYHSGRIYRVDENRNWAEAVAIKDGRFLAVGSNEQIEAFVGSNTESVDLKGAMVLPGFHDAHFHTQTGINFELDCNLGQFFSSQLQRILEQCKNRRQGNFPWMVINGLALWSGEHVDKQVLDEIFPNTPVFVHGAALHNALVNSKAIEVAGINDQTPDPLGGIIVRDPKTGEATGLLIEDSAVNLVQDHIPAYPTLELKTAAENLFKRLFSYGITSYQNGGLESGMDSPVWALLRQMDQQNEPLPTIYLHLKWALENGEPVSSLEAVIDNRDTYRTSHIRPDGVKVYLDGIPVPPKFTHVAIGRDGKVDESNLLVPRDLLTRKLEEWDQAGIKVKMHASGNGAVRVALDALAEARRNVPPTGIWHETAHSNDVSADDLGRYAQLNAVVEISPYFWHLGGGIGSTGYQFRSLFKKGALITVGSDYPVVESFNPFPPLQGIVERENESVELANAIEFFTRNGAQSMGQLDNMGSIETGKIANMIVLDRNLFEIPVSQIGDTKVLMTILDGELIYRYEQ